MDLPVEVAQFVNKLVPTDVGVDSVGDFVIHYEGFTDECNDGHNDNSIDKVYAEVFQDFDNRQGSEALIRGVANDELGCGNNPVLYSVYQNVKEMYDQEQFDKIFARRNKKNFNPEVRKYIDSKNWKLSTVNVADLDDDAIDDQFGRVIDTDPSVGVDLDEPIYVHADGRTILDGFHRVYQAKRVGKKVLPAFVPESKMNLKLVNQDISEARLYRTTRSFSNLTGEDIAKLLYLSSLSSYMMLKDDGQVNYAEQYIKQTVQYGPYTLFRSHATDLYLLAYQVKNPDNKSINLKNKVTSTSHLEKLSFDDKKHYAFFRKASNRSITKTEVGMFFLRLESQLKISDNRYRSWRRLITDWENLKYSSRQLVVTKILQEYRRLGKGSELVGPLTNMAKYKSYTISDKYKEPKTSLKTRFAGTAAGAVAGRYAGKKIAQKLGKDVDKYKKAGTGIGAIAGYWASGRIKK